VRSSLLKTLALPLLCFSIQTQAEEVDQFSNLHLPLADARTIVNAKTNFFFEKSIAEANEYGDCNENELLDRMHHYLSFKNTLNGGEFNKWLVKSSDVPRHEIRIKDSVYGEFGFFNAIFFKLGHPPSREIRIGQLRVGTDKLDHFLSRGLKYYKELQGTPPTQSELEALLDRNRQLEAGLWGQWPTGVFSYGDLASNYQGMRFWFHLFGKNSKALGKNMGPFVSCENHQWKKTKDFDWSLYLDDSMLETINCSQFADESLAQSFKTQLARISHQHDRKIQCPMDAKRFNAMKAKYDDLGISRFIINRAGISSQYHAQ